MLNLYYFKKTLIFIGILLSLLGGFLVWKLNFNLNLKLIFWGLFLVIFFSFLTIFELTNSLGWNLVFWFLLSLLVGFVSYNFYNGLIILFFGFLKSFNQNSFFKNSLKINFAKFVTKNSFFLLLAVIFIFNFHFYQNLVKKQELPLSFETFQIVISKFQNILKFFNLNLPWQESLANLGEKFLENQNLPSEVKILLKSLLPQETLSNLLYNSLKKSWQEISLRKIYISVFLGLILVIAYFLLKIVSLILGSLAMIFYYLFLKTQLIKITIRSLSKEVLEL